MIELVRRNTFREKTLIIGDRGFESYNLLAHLAEKENLDFLIRIKNNRSAMREVARLPMLELPSSAEKQQRREQNTPGTLGFSQSVSHVSEDCPVPVGQRCV